MENTNLLQILCKRFRYMPNEEKKFYLNLLRSILSKDDECEVADEAFKENNTVYFYNENHLSH